MLLVLGALGLWALEPEKGFLDWLWWSIVTMTTVGYGDITPGSWSGKMIGVVLMFFGIGILSMLTATIASFFVERKLLRERGMGTSDLENHIVICHFNHRAREILLELRADDRTAGAPIALIEDLEHKPVEDDDLHFLRGKVDEEALLRAGVDRARTVIILGDDRLEPSARDAHTVLATLTVESLNPAAYTIVELVDEANAAHCRRAKADEIIVGHQLSSRMIASAAVGHGLSKVVTEIVSQRYGNDLKQLDVPEGLAGRSFFDVLCELKKTNKGILVAVKRDDEVLTNPDADLEIGENDQLIAIVARAAA